MAAVLEVTTEERIPLAFALAVEIGHLAHGTREHQEIVPGLREVYTSLMDAPDGPVMVEFSNAELYAMGVRLFADQAELEEWWLDNRASVRAIRERALYPDQNFGRAVERFFPEAVAGTEDWDFEQVRAAYIALGRKIDQALREAAPAARALFNKERTEINRRVKEMQLERERRREERFPGHPDLEIWRPAVRTTQLGIGEMTDVDIEGRRILVANTGDGYYAIDAICTHVPALGKLATLAQGQLDAAGHCVTCPWHGSQFDLKTGRVVRQPYAPEFNREHFFSGRITSVLDPKKTATDTRVYPTKVVGNQVMVNIA